MFVKRLWWMVCCALVLVACGQGDDDVGGGSPPATIPLQTLPTVLLPTAESEGVTPTATVVVPPSAVAPATATVMPPTATMAPPTATPTRVPPLAAEKIPRERIGIQIHLHGEDLEVIRGHLRALNVGWVKVQVSWKLYQPGPDRYDDVRWAELDALVAMAEEEGIEVLLGVAKAPEWSRGTTEADGPPLDYALFRAFTTYLAERYAGRVAAYEIWNEMNLRREWTGAPMTVEAFLPLLVAGAEGIRAGDGEAIVIAGALAPSGVDDGVVAVADVPLLERLLAAGMGTHFDGLGVHPYGWANPPETTVAAPAAFVPSHNNHPTFFFAETMGAYRRLLAEAGYGDMPLWATEFGWGSFDGFGAAAPVGSEFMNDVDAYQQGAYLLGAFELAPEWGPLGPMVVWNLNFGPLLGPQFSESGYSLLGVDGRPRLGYYSLASLGE
ncbi:MAG TPA: cellulase family glycosylhydrolase [Anaerolineae bacterium]|nr:cellulase family glycosylhydrolase [Anaerolineae bacterium]